MEEIRAAAANLDAVLNEANEVLKTAPGPMKAAGCAAVAGAQAIRNTMQDRVTAVANGELQALTAALNEVPPAPSTPAAVNQAQTQLAALADRADKLAGLPLLDARTTTAVSTLRDQIARRRQAVSASAIVANELENVRRATGSAGELRTALTGFINRFPADAHTADFRTALDRLSAADALESWQAKVAAYQGVFAPTSPDDAQKRLDDLTAFLTAHPELPKAAEAAQYADYLKRAGDAMGDQGPWKTTLEPLTSNPLLGDLGYMEVSDGRRYLTQGDAKRTEHTINGQVSVTFETLNLRPDADGKVDYFEKDRPHH